jgi:TRAP transporter TAXI family solute receptor
VTAGRPPIAPTEEEPMTTRGRALAALGLLALGAAGPVGAQPVAGVGANPPGTVFYAVASGLAKAASEAGAARLTVQPYTGSSTFIPLIQSGELEFGVVNAVDTALAQRGPSFKIGGRNPFPPAPGLRLVMRGAPLLIGLVVRKDAAIRTVQDVRGKRVTGEYPAHLAVWYNMLGLLASGGLTWSDVKIVPVPAVNDGLDALVQGRADVSTFAIGGAKVKEADAAGGVRFLSTDCSPAGEARLRKAVPGYYPRWVKAGSSTGIVEDTCAVAYDLYLATGRTVADPLVEAVLKGVWEHVEALPPIHPIFREWTRDRAVDPDVTLPYHPAAVRFYRERGAWTAGMDQAQQRLLGP